MQTIILIRHGYPISWDEKLKVRGPAAHLRLDSGLAEVGRAQAHCAAQAVLATGGVVRVMSSPFRKCLETADLIAAACGAPVAPDWRIGEVLLSQVLGSPFSPLSAMDPDWAERRSGAGKPSHPESDQTLHDRVARVINELKASKPLAQRIAIVSHEIILKELYQAMTGRKNIIDWHPGAITTLTRAKAIDRQWKIVGELASVQHLGVHDRCEPTDNIVHTYHPLDSRS